MLHMYKNKVTKNKMKDPNNPSLETVNTLIFFFHISTLIFIKISRIVLIIYTEFMVLFDLQIFIPLYTENHFMLMVVDLLVGDVKIWDSGRHR